MPDRLDYEIGDILVKLGHLDQGQVNEALELQKIRPKRLGELLSLGRPVLVGTRSIEVSEMLSERLKRLGVEHERAGVLQGSDDGPAGHASVLVQYHQRQIGHRSRGGPADCQQFQHTAEQHERW